MEVLEGKGGAFGGGVGATWCFIKIFRAAGTPAALPRPLARGRMGVGSGENGGFPLRLVPSIPLIGRDDVAHSVAVVEAIRRMCPTGPCVVKDR